jgi:hypothetical protein
MVCPQGIRPALPLQQLLLVMMSLMAKAAAQILKTLLMLW